MRKYGQLFLTKFADSRRNWFSSTHSANEHVHLETFDSDQIPNGSFK